MSDSLLFFLQFQADMVNRSIYDFISNSEAANLHNLLNNYNVTTGNGEPEYEKGM